MPKYLTTEVQSCRFICYGCQLYISIFWGDILLDLTESCPESCAGRIFAQTNSRLNGIWSAFAKFPKYWLSLIKYSAPGGGGGGGTSVCGHTGTCRLSWSTF